LAARKAQKAASFKDAIIHAEKRTSCLEKLPRTVDAEKNIIDSRLTLGLYNVQSSYFNEGKEAIESIIDLAIKHGDQKKLSQIYTILGTHSLSQEDYPKAFQYLQEAIKIAEESKDFTTLWVASHWMGHALAENCEFEKALIHLERDLQISTFANILWSISIMKSCLAMTVYCIQGKVGLAYETSQEGLRLAEESGDTFSKAEANSSCGYSFLFRGFLDQAKIYLTQGITFSERINYSTMSMAAHVWLGITCFKLTDYRKCQEYFNKYISACEQRKMWPSRGANLGKIYLALAKVMNNDKAINLEFLYEIAERNKVKYLEGHMAAHISQILMNLDDNHLIESEHWIQKAIEADQRNRTMYFLGEDYALYAELFKRKGDRLKAQENLGKAIEILKECGADGWVEKYEKELATTS
jgi:tetratricopeptide (TPR) repeat protein